MKLHKENKFSDAGNGNPPVTETDLDSSEPDGDDVEVNTNTQHDDENSPPPADEIDSGSSDSEDMSDDSDEIDDDEVISDEEGSSPENGDDETIKAMLREQEARPRNNPPDIILDSMIADISFHPENDLIAVADMDGKVSLFSYSLDKNEVTRTLSHHTKACRDVEFSDDGKNLITSSKDKSICVVDIESGSISLQIKNAHEAPVNCLYNLNETSFASGHEDGTVKVWDSRQQNPSYVFKEMEDYVTSMVSTEALKTLLCASGDGVLTALNLRSRKLDVQSEVYDTDLNCLALVRQDTKVAVGSSDGKLYIFNWGEFGYHSDLYPGHPDSINCIIPITDKMVITGCDDGILRAVHLFPHQFTGVVGQHKFPVEKLDVSHDGHLIASYSHDQTVRFWNTTYFEDIEVDESDNKKGKNRNKNPRNMSKHLPSSRHESAREFFSGLT